MRPSYRADIDGLRAVAVLAILLFHAGIAGFDGGYVGVDVFYVISGYLITGIIANGLADGRFSVTDFYVRRVRRIFPALFAMLAATTVAAWFVFWPLDLQRFGTALLGAVGFVANIQAWMQSGYFDPAAETKPLLHTWSLAVEEQFYLFFPWVLVVFRLHRPAMKVAVWGLFLASLGLAIVGVRVDTDATFYLLPTRAWELLTGSLVALGAVPVPRGRAAREMLGALGLGMILVATFAYTPFTPFPGEAALLPCIGSALIILSGGQGATTLAGRLLSLPPMRLVGLASYSLYLWHWPIIVVAHHLVVRDFTGPEKIGLIVASFAAAILSWRFVETPFRHAGDARRPWSVFAPALGAMALACAVGLVMMPTGFPGRYSGQMQALFDQIEKPEPVFDAYKGNPAYAGLRLPGEGFIAGKGDGPSDLVIWGDSHVGMMLPFVKHAIDSGREKAVTVIAKGGCRPVAGTYIGYDADLTCAAHNAAVLDYLRTSPERRVVLVSRWGISLFGDVTPEGTGIGRPSLAAAPGHLLSVADAEALFRARLPETIDALLAAGKEVTLVEPFAEIPFEGKRMVFNRVKADPALSLLTVPLAPYVERYTRITAILDDVLKDRPVRRIAPLARQCPDGACVLYRDGRIHFADNNHLTWGAAAELVPIFEPLLRRD